MALGSRFLVTPLALATIAFAACSEPPTALPSPYTAPPSALTPLANEVHQQATTWTKQILPVLYGKTGARANDISDNGIVVGESMTLPYGTDERPAYWTPDGRIHALQAKSATTGFATAISDNGIFVVGYTRVASYQQAVRWTLAVSNPPAVQLQTCGLKGDPIATGVNNAGVVVGAIGLTAVSWKTISSCPTPIVVAGKTMTIARGINDVSTKVGLGHWNAWSPRGFVQGYLNTALAPLSGHAWTDAHAVNDANVVVGKSWYPGGSSWTAVYWGSGSNGPVALGYMSNAARVAISDKGRFVWGTQYNKGMTKIGIFSAALTAIPLGVNVCGDIVGLENGQAVRYKKTVCD